MITASYTLRIWLASIVLMLYPPLKMYPNDIGLQNQHVLHANEVASDIYDIIYDPLHTSWFNNKWGRAQEAALITIIAAEESGGLDPEVEAGRVRGDNGASWCLMAINIGRGKTKEGWTGPDLIADRKKCLISGLNAVQRSMNICRGLGMLSGLSAYNTGRCIKNERISVSRVSRALYLVNKNVPVDDVALGISQLIQDTESEPKMRIRSFTNNCLF